MRVILSMLLLIPIAANGQNKGSQPFVLDQGKPYVYIAFDHAGKREPLGRGESKEGFWFRFVNNCRVPVTIGTFDAGTEDLGVGVFDEVVKIQTGGSGGIPEAPEPGRSEPIGRAPEGYYSEVGSAMTVSPGERVLFSVPSNHLSPRWYLRVRFTLAVSPSKVGDQPYSYADFRWEQLPEDVRSRRKNGRKKGVAWQPVGVRLF